jgi:hypothetical protein
LVLNPTDGELTFYFLAAWSKEPGGITSQAAFETYLMEIMAILDSPLSVKIL